MPLTIQVAVRGNFKKTVTVKKYLSLLGKPKNIKR